MQIVRIDAVELFDAYCQMAGIAVPSSQYWDRGREVLKRLEHLDMVLLEVQEGVDKYERVSGTDTEKADLLLREMEMHAEAFYDFAFRARNVLRSLPGLENFEAAGVRNVRNKLLQHPEGKDSRVLRQGFALRAEVGPAMRTIRSTDDPQVWQDAGLNPNAQEFRDKLHALLQAFLSGAADEHGPRKGGAP